MPALVECVPNFSEGRDKTRVDAILEAMKMDGVYLLDREMDADHHRCVITLVGDPVNVAEAAIRGVGKAAELIDLTKHSGAHPRLGAADVIPFIPIDGITLEDCAAIARRVGEEIWKRYKVPVYLYEAAAQTPAAYEAAPGRDLLDAIPNGSARAFCWAGACAAAGADLRNGARRTGHLARQSRFDESRQCVERPARA